MTKPDFLCNWNHCRGCIAYRIKNNIKIPPLKQSSTMKQIKRAEAISRAKSHLTKIIEDNK